MALALYNKKRNFKQTTEPEGKKAKAKKNLIFVVQQHAASHLHYDFRLQMRGVLISWAVPKGPSMNPDEKKLAMRVEDHPYSYKDFEGEIPAGNYGAGNVIVWDNGTYNAANAKDKGEDEKVVVAGLKKGHISFILHGKKLKGEFALIRMHGRQENAWLLVKKDDAYATTDDVLEKNKSVISKKPLQFDASKYSSTKKTASAKKTPLAKSTANIQAKISKKKP